MKRRIKLKQRKIWPVRNDIDFREYLQSKRTSLQEKRISSRSIRRKKFFIREMKEIQGVNFKMVVSHGVEAQMYKYTCQRVRESFIKFRQRRFNAMLLSVSAPKMVERMVEAHRLIADARKKALDLKLALES